MKEIWKKIPGYPSYSISTIGRVRRDVPKFGFKLGILKGHTVGGYKRISIVAGNKKRPHAKVHRLMLITFKGPCPPGRMGLHSNDVKADNRLSNLYWGTPQQNFDDRKKNGIVSGQAGLTFEERNKSSKKAHATIKRNGTSIGMAALTIKERKISAQKAIQTKRQKGIPLNGNVSKEKRREASLKAVKTKLRLGIPLNGNISKEEQHIASIKGWVTRKRNKK